MVTSLTNAAGVLARFLLAATALLFNGPRLLQTSMWAHPAAQHLNTQPNKEKGGFHAELTVGRGKKQVTVQLEFGGARERSEDESL